MEEEDYNADLENTFDFGGATFQGTYHPLSLLFVVASFIALLSPFSFYSHFSEYIL